MCYLLLAFHIYQCVQCLIYKYVVFCVLRQPLHSIHYKFKDILRHIITYKPEEKCMFNKIHSFVLSMDKWLKINKQIKVNILLWLGIIFCCGYSSRCAQYMLFGCYLYVRYSIINSMMMKDLFCTSWQTLWWVWDYNYCNSICRIEYYK